MNRNDIETALRNAAGTPDSGAVADVIPAFVDAIVALSAPASTGGKPAEKRIVEAQEKR